MTLTKKKPSRQPRLPNQSTLRFSPTAWAKLLFLRDLGETEVGGFAICPSDDLLLVENVQLVGQVCTAVSVVFDDESVADFFDQQVDRNLKPEQFARIWVHTHPGNCPLPSATDEETFARAFGQSDWAVMFILAQGGQVYCRLRFNVGPGGEAEIPVQVDYSQPFDGSDCESWEAEYDAYVTEDCTGEVAPAKWQSIPRLQKSDTESLLDECLLAVSDDESDDWWDSWGAYAHQHEEEDLAT